MSFPWENKWKICCFEWLQGTKRWNYSTLMRLYLWFNSSTSWRTLVATNTFPVGRELIKELGGRSFPSLKLIFPLLLLLILHLWVGPWPGKPPQLTFLWKRSVLLHFPMCSWHGKKYLSPSVLDLWYWEHSELMGGAWARTRPMSLCESFIWVPVSASKSQFLCLIT